MNGMEWRKPLALLCALALCAAAAEALSPPAAEEPGWLPRVEGFSLEAAESSETAEESSDTAEESSDTAEESSDTAGIAEISASAESAGETDAPDAEALLVDVPDAAPVSEEEAAMAFDPEHPSGTPSATDAGADDSAEKTDEGTGENTDGRTDSEEGTDSAPAVPVVETLPEVEALLEGPDEDSASPLAGPDDGGGLEPEALTDKDIKNAEKLQRLIDQVTTEPVELDSLDFADVEALARSGNLTVLGLEETIGALESLDYDKLLNNLRDSLNAISNSQDMIQTQISSLNQMNASDRVAGIAASASISSMKSTYNSLYQQFESIYKGDMQRSNRDVARQLRNTIDQVVMGTEALYISLCALETQEGALDRQLAALDRTVEEMELRHKLGQISDLQLGEVKAGRSSLASGKETLGMNVRTLKMQLENMLGAVPTGTLALGELPAVTQKQIEAMDMEADLLSAKEKSYELYAAARTLEDQQETYQDSLRSAHYNTRSAAYQQAVHNWNANQTTYNSTVRSYDLRFRTLCQQVRDYYQVWNAARTALAQQNKSWQASQLKYRQGNLSHNALLSAKDDLQTAMEKVQSSANDLFSAYNNYCWAVQHGILN